MKFWQAIKAFEEGKTVEWNYDGTWYELRGSQNFVFSGLSKCQFRVKEKPMEMLVDVIEGTPIIHNFTGKNVTKSRVRFIEVVEEENAK